MCKQALCINANCSIYIEMERVLYFIVIKYTIFVAGTVLRACLYMSHLKSFRSFCSIETTRTNQLLLLYFPTTFKFCFTKLHYNTRSRFSAMIPARTCYSPLSLNHTQRRRSQIVRRPSAPHQPQSALECGLYVSRFKLNETLQNFP